MQHPVGMHFNPNTAGFGEGPYAEITIDNGESALPVAFSVGNGYPNPFNPSVTVPFALPQAGEVTFALFNILGQRLFSHSQTYLAGRHDFLFDAAEAGGTGASGSGAPAGLVSGVYFLQVQFNGQVMTQKIVLLR